MPDRLKKYREMRDFAQTPEPSGGKPKSKVKLPMFVIQKHAATRLHYDFRLEMEGVLKSWAVPKGPSYDPTQKRLAMMTEDHPYDYGSFEGVIPEGEYGAGTVMVWDRGTWIPEDEDVDAALRRGELKVTLQGTKLKGSWVLVRTRSGYPASSGREAWLLIKHRDAHASDRDVTATMPRSVISNRTLAEIAQAEGGNIKKAASGDPSTRGRRRATAVPAPRVLPDRPARRSASGRARTR